MIRHRTQERLLTICLIALMVLPVGAKASTTDQTSSSPLTGRQVDQNGDRALARLDAGSPPQPASENTLSPAQQVAPSSQSQAPTPLGTAAAPDTRVDGVPASTPTGAAIAPAKQRRVFKFSIRTALVIGAVVAVGVVAGASLASPSHP
jgi:hypothetical protein